MYYLIEEKFAEFIRNLEGIRVHPAGERVLEGGELFLTVPKKYALARVVVSMEDTLFERVLDRVIKVITD